MKRPYDAGCCGVGVAEQHATAAGPNGADQLRTFVHKWEAGVDVIQQHVARPAVPAFSTVVVHPEA